MDRTERLYRINQLLESRRVVPFHVLEQELEVSPATLKRDLEYLRTRLNAPIVWDREQRGYRFEVQKGRGAGPRFELPGLWFNESEAYALLAMQHLLAGIQPGLLSESIAPMKAQIAALLDGAGHPTAEVTKRIRLLPMGKRRVASSEFEAIAKAVLTRNRLRITHLNRERGETLVREVSPQRLVHYRDNWYLDAWCHLRDGLRVFSLDAISAVETLSTRARNVPDRELDEELAEGYGIFAGRPRFTALLRFTPQRARWTANEQWHPKQRAWYDEDGYYLLEVPYADDREIVMDVLRHGAEVEVLKPAALREKVAKIAGRVRDINSVVGARD
jgi:predicted DNA-binding transcriptional regulator YafY